MVVVQPKYLQMGGLVSLDRRGISHSKISPQLFFLCFSVTLTDGMMLMHTMEGTSSLLSLFVQMLSPCINNLTDTLRNHVLPAFWGIQNPFKFSHSHCIGALYLKLTSKNSISTSKWDTSVNWNL